MEEKKIIKETIDDGIRITEYSNGSTEFTAIKEPISTEPNMRNLIKKAKDWYDNLKIKPFIQVKDLNKPEKKRWWDEGDPDTVDHIDSECDERPAVVVGFKMEF